MFDEISETHFIQDFAVFLSQRDAVSVRAMSLNAVGSVQENRLPFVSVNPDHYSIVFAFSIACITLMQFLVL